MTLRIRIGEPDAHDSTPGFVGAAAIDTNLSPSESHSDPSGCGRRIGLEPGFNVKGVNRRPGYGRLVGAEALRVKGSIPVAIA